MLQLVFNPYENVRVKTQVMVSEGNEKNSVTAGNWTLTCWVRDNQQRLKDLNFWQVSFGLFPAFMICSAKQLLSVASYLLIDMRLV